MVAKDFEVGDLVWAKMKGYPDWPARIESPPANTPAKKARHYVFFFGSENYSWIPDENIKHHSEEILKNRSKLKRADFEKGIEEIVKESQSSPPKKLKSPAKPANEKKEKEAVKPKIVKHVNKVSKENGEKLKKSPVLKPAKKRRLTNEDKSSPPAKVQKSSYSTLYDNVLPSIGLSYVVIAPEKENSTEATLSPKKVVEQKTGESAKKVKQESEASFVKKVKQIGFLGLGMMGTGMVRNLLNSGHSVMIWNRTHEKCMAFEQSRAIVAQSPAEVVKHCDITFCCVSDPHAVKTIIFGDNGVLKGFESCERKTKGYVEMTSIDADTSQGIAEAIAHTGMKYLEAPIIGSRKRAEEGTILILGSGDRELFNDCESCFHAMSNHAYYISCEVGKSANINIITSMFLGTVYAALAEALSLTERLKLSQNDLLEILCLRGITCPLLMEKGKAILEKNFNPDTYLKHQQKDLELALNLSNTCDQSMPVSTAANEIFKHARRLGCSDYDTAAVYHGVRF